MCESTIAEDITKCEGPDYWPETARKSPKDHQIGPDETVFWAKPYRKRNVRPFCVDCGLFLGYCKPSEVLNAKLRAWKH